MVDLIFTDQLGNQGLIITVDAVHTQDFHFGKNLNIFKIINNPNAPVSHDFKLLTYLWDDFFNLAISEPGFILDAFDDNSSFRYHEHNWGGR